MIAFDRAMAELPLVAILRGLQPDKAEEVGLALAGAGFRIVEVPLNSPQPLESIRILRQVLPPQVVVGAGTVTSVQAVEDVVAAGGQIIVMPHADTAVIRAAKTAGAICMPGVATPTEAFAALNAGADALKAFPGEGIPPAVLKAWMAILPRGTKVLPVGGIVPERMEPYLKAGAAGFGLGTAVYTPGADGPTVAAAATRFVEAWQALTVASA